MNWNTDIDRNQRHCICALMRINNIDYYFTRREHAAQGPVYPGELLSSEENIEAQQSRRR